MAMNPAQRRYIGRMIPVSIAYVAAIFAASAIIPKGATATPLTVGIALVPGLAILGFIWAIGRYFTELKDEYVRMLEVRKALVATGLTLALTATWGILELYTDVPRIPLFWVFPVWCLGLGVGALFNRLTLGDSGACP
ncbi:hypothetical protein EEB18_004805 [Sphingopyxis sp. OPL5]|uniref:hypothetical protein n=1 Tax=unclassified Sphingopyxis TaxID=2614943 RepID=UPI0006FA451F|nr:MULTISPECIES: hypothetical protein [unclassified Sphingopyxis]KQZ60667.1 hypothetical protein ASD67_15240 [Sphingopyxis sp. Root1497]OHD03926.1 MAG: hypothetical protein A2885_20845 [Sphingopyxis sp. RIFCSPHIGHO2_01_FULL_65_24]QNO28277.1 hypothetical protein EEB18_004805 [Sphingopyxis sp. OPL5]